MGAGEPPGEECDRRNRGRVDKNERVGVLEEVGEKEELVKVSDSGGRTRLQSGKELKVKTRAEPQR